MSTLLKLYDFPDPMQTSGGRDLTTTPLQQLFVMNSSFMRNAADGVGAERERRSRQCRQAAQRCTARFWRATRVRKNSTWR